MRTASRLLLILSVIALSICFFACSGTQANDAGSSISAASNGQSSADANNVASSASVSANPEDSPPFEWPTECEDREYGAISVPVPVGWGGHEDSQSISYVDLSSTGFRLGRGQIQIGYGTITGSASGKEEIARDNIIKTYKERFDNANFRSEELTIDGHVGGEYSFTNALNWETRVRFVVLDNCYATVMTTYKPNDEYSDSFRDCVDYALNNIKVVNPDFTPNIISQDKAKESEKPQQIPKEYQSALKKAQSYNDNMHMSKAGLYDQLTSEYGEKFSAEAAQYAVDNVRADWNANALATARNYQDLMDMSPAAIYDQLVSDYGEKFTAEEAQYAIDNL